MKVEDFYFNQPLTQMSQPEIDCLLEYIGPEDIVLEIGSGYSTLSLSSICQKLYSVEHNADWYRKIYEEIRRRNIKNVIYTLKISNSRIIEDGDLNSLKDYIEYVGSLHAVPFTKILIDGRARVECAFTCGPAHPNALFFLHDYGRYTKTNRPWRKKYSRILERFDLIKKVDTLAVLKYK